jgi:hypothetical protein
MTPSRPIFLRLTTSEHQFPAEKPIFLKIFSENSIEHTITNHHLPFTNLWNLWLKINQMRRGLGAKIRKSKNFLTSLLITT